MGLITVVMKEVLLKDLSVLLSTDDLQERIDLQEKVSRMLDEARFDLATESEAHTKNLIISTVKNYVATSDTALKTALAEHLKTIEDYFKE